VIAWREWIGRVPLGARQPIDVRVETLQEPEHVIEASVLEHENHECFDRLGHGAYPPITRSPTKARTALTSRFAHRPPGSGHERIMSALQDSPAVPRAN